MARRRLPGFVNEYLEGGSEDEQTLRGNREAFGDLRFIPRVLVDVANRSMASTLLGKPCGMPLVIGPTGFNGLLWREGDIALARAAREREIPFTVSIVASDSLEAIAKHAGGRLWMMLLMLRDTAVVERLIARADAAGCEALVITLDASVYGNRTWDSRNFARPLVLSLRAKLDVLVHLRWLFGVLLPRGLPGFGNLAEFLPDDQRSPLDGSRYITSQSNAGLTWEAIRALRERWKRKLVLKGIMAVADAEEAARIGVDGIVLSNHGGRQLDSEVAPIQVLEDVVAAVGQRLEVMIDGGFRRGTDVVKALALGARAVLLGRTPLYGLAAGGQAGAARALTILRDEIDRTLALLGCPSIGELSPQYVGHYEVPRRRGVELKVHTSR
ncbi:MAG: hypothetical protein JWO36_2867 [Myxococcales bacterium]|nr:hypothetical protein [Myxococcales bacterium]